MQLRINVYRIKHDSVRCNLYEETHHVVLSLHTLDCTQDMADWRYLGLGDRLLALAYRSTNKLIP